MGTGGQFAGAKERPGRGSDHSPPSTSKIKNELELCVLSLDVPSLHVEWDSFSSFSTVRKEDVVEIIWSRKCKYILFSDLSPFPGDRAFALVSLFIIVIV
jgi:hypothetical protein